MAVKIRSRKSEARSRKWRALLLLLLLGCSVARAEDFASLCADRTAIEHVYYNHRTGTKPPFAVALPQATLESLVRLDLKKEAVLRDRYGVTITPTMLDAEVQRINTTTRAPEMLAEIKTALGNDPSRFAESFAKPFLVERLLRDKFENDDALHAGQRQECESIRTALLGAKTNGATPAQLLAELQHAGSNAVQKLTWQLTPHPTEPSAPTPDELEIKKRFGPDAQILSSPGNAAADRKFYFEDLPAELQRVLRVQLRQAGDVSAVIETPGGFLLYIATETTGQVLSVGCLSLPKLDYEQWLNEQKVKL
jgi:hypothetical protein